MEEGEAANQEESTAKEQPKTKVGFPQPKKEGKKSNRLLVIIIIVLLVLLGLGVWYLFAGSQNGLSTEETPTPTVTTVETSTPTPTQAEPEREGVTIQILNGTGLAGAAGDLQKEFETLGYGNIEVGNAKTQDSEETQAVFSSDIDPAVQKEIVKALEEIFEKVTTKSSQDTQYDIVVTTGYPKGHSVTATPTKKASVTNTPTPTSKATTATVTTSPSPTPTP